MQVLMISDVYFPRINGVSTSIETFRQALATRGVEVSLIAPAYDEQDPGDDDAALMRVPSRQLPLDPEDRMMRRSSIDALLPDLRKRQFDLVHIQTPFVAHYAGVALAARLNLPCVATYHTFFEEYLYHYIPFLPREWLKGLARRFSRQQCNALDAVIVPSRAMRDTLAAYGVERPMHVLPTGLPESRFAGGDGCYFRNRYGIPKSRKLLLFVGRVAHEKNIGFLIEMLGHLRMTQPEALLLITGEGPAVGALKQSVSQSGLEDAVRFLGYLDRHNELHDCYRAADIFVFASRTETQGLVLLEAMAIGRPVVALARMGTCDILAGERGCRIAPDDPRGFAQVVNTLLTLDKPARLTLEQEARQHAREWHADEMAGRLQRLYETLLAAHRNHNSLDDAQMAGSRS